MKPFTAGLTRGTVTQVGWAVQFGEGFAHHPELRLTVQCEHFRIARLSICVTM
jgi:hypothetical protein